MSRPFFERELPPGWFRAALGSQYEITKRPRGLYLADSDTVPFVSMEGVSAGSALHPRFVQRPVGEIASGTYFEKGDLLLPRITPSFENGKQAIADNIPARFGFASTELIPIRARPGANVDFLHYLLLNPDVRSYLAERMEGSTGRQRVPENALLSMQIPIPPVESQRAIVFALRQFDANDNLEGRRVQLLAELQLASMNELFGDSDEWPSILLGECGRIGNGSTPKRDRSAYWVGGTIPWLTSGKVHERRIRAADEFVTETAVRECHLPRVPAGSLLVAITGQGKTLGNVALTEIETCVSQHLAYLSFERTDVLPDFIRYYLSNRYHDLRALGQSGGSTKGALTCATLRGFRVPIPDLAVQHRICSVLDAIERRLVVHRKRQRTTRQGFEVLLHELTTGQRRIHPGAAS